MDIKKASKLGAKDNLVFLISSDKDLSSKDFSKEEITYIKKEIKSEHKQIEIGKNILIENHQQINARFFRYEIRDQQKFSHRIEWTEQFQEHFLTS